MDSHSESGSDHSGNPAHMCYERLIDMLRRSYPEAETVLIHEGGQVYMVAKTAAHAKKLASGFAPEGSWISFSIH